MLDTKGPEIRTGLLEDHKKVVLKEGEEFVLYTEERVGNEKAAPLLMQDWQKMWKRETGFSLMTV